MDDRDIVTALVAGMIHADIAPRVDWSAEEAPNPPLFSYAAEKVVEAAEMLVAEVLRRSNEREDSE